MTRQRNPSAYAAQVSELLATCGVSQPVGLMIDGESIVGRGKNLVVRSPIDGGVLAEFCQASGDDLRIAAERSKSAFAKWKTVPPPVRGELVRRIGNQFRECHRDLAQLITIECGKILSESLGEVQEMIDICDFANGLSRQLYGLTIASERPFHRLIEQWHPLGPIGVISAFNFPVAVWSWNAMLALVCGNPVLWKPSEKTPLTAMAVHALASRAADSLPELPSDLLQLVVGDSELGTDPCRRCAIPIDLGHRIRRDGPRRWPSGRGAIGAVASRTRREQCDDCGRFGGRRSGQKGDRLFSGRHLWPTLHVAAALADSGRSSWLVARTTARGLWSPSDRQSLGGGNVGRPID